MCMSWEVLLFTDKKQGLGLLSNRKKMGSGNKTRTIWVKFKTTEMCLSGWNTVVWLELPSFFSMHYMCTKVGFTATFSSMLYVDAVSRCLSAGGLWAQPLWLWMPAYGRFGASSLWQCPALWCQHIFDSIGRLNGRMNVILRERKEGKKNKKTQTHIVSIWWGQYRRGLVGTPPSTPSGNCHFGRNTVAI